MIQVSIIHRHFAGVIKFVAVDDDLRVQLRREPSAGMKRWHVVHRTIVCRSDV